MPNNMSFLFKKRRWKKRRREKKRRENMQKPLHISIYTHIICKCTEKGLGRGYTTLLSEFCLREGTGIWDRRINGDLS